MRAVNLLPRDDGRERRRTNVPVLVGVGGAVAVTGVLSLLFMSANGNVRSKRSQLDDVRAELAATPVPHTPTSGETTLAEQKQQRVAALAAALSRRVAWDRVLRELSQVLPDDVWLATLTANAPLLSTAAAAPAAPDPGADPTGFVIQGYTYSQDAVARLLARLQVLPDLQNVQLQTSVAQPVGDQRVVHFTLVADVRAAGSSS